MSFLMPCVVMIVNRCLEQESGVKHGGCCLPAQYECSTLLIGDTQHKTEEQQSLPSALILARKVGKGTKPPSQGVESKSSPGSWLRVLRSIYWARAAGAPSPWCSMEQGAQVRPGAPAELRHPATFTSCHMYLQPAFVRPTKADSISVKKSPNYYRRTSLLSSCPLNVAGKLNRERAIMV